MVILEQEAITVYADVMALLLMLGIVILSRPNRKQRRDEDTMFMVLAVCQLLACVGSIMCHSVRGQDMDWTHGVALFGKTIEECAMLLLAAQWMLYVDFLLYRSLDRLRRRYVWGLIPVFIFLVLLILNLFMDVIFTLCQDNSWQALPLYYMLRLVEIAYVLIPALVVFQYRKFHGNLRFFHPGIVVVPAVGGVVISELAWFSVDGLGTSIALLFLYYSMVNGWRFEDRESGFYNREYLSWLTKHSTEEGIRAAVVFGTDSAPRELTAILRAELPKNAQIVKLAPGWFLFFTENGNRSSVKFLADMVCDAAGERDEESSMKINVKARTLSRKKDETITEFLARAAVQGR